MLYISFNKKSNNLYLLGNMQKVCRSSLEELRSSANLTVNGIFIKRIIDSPFLEDRQIQICIEHPADSSRKKVETCFSFKEETAL